MESVQFHEVEIRYSNAEIDYRTKSLAVAACALLKARLFDTGNPFLLPKCLKEALQFTIISAEMGFHEFYSFAAAAAV